MSRPVRQLLKVLLTLVTASLLWWLWPRSNDWRVRMPAPGKDVVVVVDPEWTSEPVVRLPGGSSWEVLRAELVAVDRIDTAGADLARVLSQLKPMMGRIALLGSGLGGRMALEASLAHAPIDRLILVSTSATGDCSASDQRQLERMPLFFRLNAHRVDLQPRLRGLVVPTLVLAGSQDPATRAGCSTVLASQIAGARLEKIPSAGPHVLRDAPDVTGELIAGFLK